MTFEVETAYRQRADALELHFSTTQTCTRVDGTWRYLAGQTAPIDLG